MANLDQRIALGRHAEELLANELFQGACRAVDAQIRDEVFRTNVGDLDRREALFSEYKGFQRILAKLSSWKSDGKLAETEV